MQRKNIEIKDDFEYFTELTYGEKSVKENSVYLEQKETHKDWLSKTTSIEHSTISEKVDLTIERKKSFYKYGIKLACKDFSNEPFFRFDSDGPAHRNTSSDIPLSEQKVTTPHFNSFDKNGFAIAYKTDVLKKDNEAKAIAENIEFGLSHFFQETNINQGENANILEIGLKIPELFEYTTETDPLNGVNFIN
ncbi:hypothetical protein [Mariniflexile sp. AS56]|uniref:hypothetical protein n=1 Tax=Mariniflexile sp. AS56 TaxID=3063957 RepID=UPI0026F13E97|nr:hypothetical protein [Mariniflexile sp. AS56]MDO7170839.1 hypothetical protein [Mariniflexile sp. AS56]